jgi:hypothetical protein
MRLANWHHEHLYLMQHNIQFNKSMSHMTDDALGNNLDSPTMFFTGGDLDGLFFRNGSYNGSFLNITSQWLQHPPLVGTLRFDYVVFAGITDSLVSCFSPSKLSHSTTTGVHTLECNIFRENEHLLTAGSYGSAFNNYRLLSDQKSLNAGVNQVFLFDRIFSQSFHHSFHRLLQFPLDGRLEDVEMLKKENFADWIIHQIFANESLKKSQRICKKLRIPAKNSMVCDPNDPECRDYLEKLKTSATLKSSSSNDDNPRTEVVNIMLNKLKESATSAPDRLRSAKTMISQQLNKNSECSDEDSDSYDEQDEDSDGNTNSKSLPKFKVSDKTEKLQLSKKSYLRLQDETSDLDLGSRKAFVLKRAPNSGKFDNTNQFASRSSQLRRQFESQSWKMWKDFMFTNQSNYVACYEETFLQQTSALFSSLQKQFPSNFRFNYSVGSERYVDELTQNELFGMNIMTMC